MNGLFTSGGQSTAASASACPSNEYSGLVSFRIHWLYLLAVQETLKSLLQHHGVPSIYCVKGKLNAVGHGKKQQSIFYDFLMKFYEILGLLPSCCKDLAGMLAIFLIYNFYYFYF